MRLLVSTTAPPLLSSSLPLLPVLSSSPSLDATTAPPQPLHPPLPEKVNSGSFFFLLLLLPFSCTKTDSKKRRNPIAVNEGRFKIKTMATSKNGAQLAHVVTGLNLPLSPSSPKTVTATLFRSVEGDDFKCVRKGGERRECCKAVYN